MAAFSTTLCQVVSSFLWDVIFQSCHAICDPLLSFDADESGGVWTRSTAANVDRSERTPSNILLRPCRILKANHRGTVTPTANALATAIYAGNPDHTATTTTIGLGYVHCAWSGHS